MISPCDPTHPVIFVLDQSPVVPKVLRLILQRHAGVLTTVAAFTDPNLAARWLTGAMDKQKAEYPFQSPWDDYPPLTSVALAIVDCEEFPKVRGLRILDWVSALLPPSTPLVTTSLQRRESKEEGSLRLLSVAHLPKPLERQEVVARLLPLLTSAIPTRMMPVVSPTRMMPVVSKAPALRRVHLQQHASCALSILSLLRCLGEGGSWGGGEPQ